MASDALGSKMLEGMRSGVGRASTRGLINNRFKHAVPHDQIWEYRRVIEDVLDNAKAAIAVVKREGRPINASYEAHMFNDAVPVVVVERSAEENHRLRICGLLERSPRDHCPQCHA